MANRIVIDSTTFTPRSFLNGKGVSSHSLAGETLSADTVQFDFVNDDLGFVPADYDETLITADEGVMTCKSFTEDFATLKENSVVQLYVDNIVYSRSFLESIEQITKNKYTAKASSAIAKLINNKHFGGMYSNYPVATLIGELLQGISYVLDAAFSGVTITGYLPIQDKRDNLRDLLLAIGGSITTRSDGVLVVAPPSKNVTGTFDITRCYENGRVEDVKKVKGLKLTEHNYFQNNEVDTLYNDGLLGTEHLEFDEPHWGYTITGGTIVRSGANYCDISGAGSVVLTGKKYTHITRIISVGDTSGDSSDVKSVSQCQLANPQIAQNMAERIFRMLQYNTKIKRDVKVGTERAGDVVNVLHPYTKQLVQATMQSLDIRLSAVNRASAEFVVGYLPADATAGFDNYTRLTGSGTWTAPKTGVARIILFGAGGGGGGGYNGAKGEDGYASATGAVSTSSPDEYRGGKGGAGGKAGAGGAGGKVFEININIVLGQQYTWNCGVGGAGGAINGGAGNAGAETTFGSYSSAYGRAYADGYYEAKTNTTYCINGQNGTAGGSGGNGTDKIGYWAQATGGSGQNVASWVGGAGTVSDTFYSGVDDRTSIDCGGVGGGGAAIGGNGSSGVKSWYRQALTLTAGVGASASAPAPTPSFGSGGSGGNGGGGGGGGTVRESFTAGDWVRYVSVTTGGAGGAGSAGGQGGAGAIVIYY